MSWLRAYIHQLYARKSRRGPLSHVTTPRPSAAQPLTGLKPTIKLLTAAGLAHLHS